NIDVNVQASRLRLCQVTSETLKCGLNLLGIEVMEKM
ncbi:MAG: DALR anticodon-binding domain-containing protein, partial [Pseudomonadota bacterium]|nr:DALR anticodon-binding domain-containing protein [Pseudomonadota bacterium]